MPVLLLFDKFCASSCVSMLIQSMASNLRIHSNFYDEIPYYETHISQVSFITSRQPSSSYREMVFKFITQKQPHLPHNGCQWWFGLHSESLRKRKEGFLALYPINSLINLEKVTDVPFFTLFKKGNWILECCWKDAASFKQHKWKKE